MTKFKEGDIVSRMSYGCDIKFKVDSIKDVNGKKLYILKGITYRLIADAYEDDLVLHIPDKSDQKKVESLNNSKSLINRVLDKNEIRRHK